MTSAHNEIYPYDIPMGYHPLAWVFFHAAGMSMDLDTAQVMAKHVFDDLGCGEPGTSHNPSIKYDALGSGGGPWEPGVWIPAGEGRMQVVATAPPVDVTAMSVEQRAELQAALDAAADAEAADAIKRNSDENQVGD